MSDNSIGLLRLLILGLALIISTAIIVFRPTTQLVEQQPKDGGLIVGSLAPSASGIVQSYITSTGQAPQQYTYAGGAYKVSISGTFVGTIGFSASQDGGNTFSAANLSQSGLYNCSTCTFDTSTTGTGAWYYAPISGTDGILQLQATAWTSGTATISIVDLVATPQKIDIMLIPSATRTTTFTSANTIVVPGCFKAMELHLNITSASGTGGLAPTFNISDPLTTGVYLTASIGTAHVGTGLFVYQIGPAQGLAALDGGVLVNYLPPRIIPKVVASDSSSYTYSLGATLFPY